MISVSDEYKVAAKAQEQEVMIQGWLDDIPLDESIIEAGSLKIQWQHSDGGSLQIGTAYVGEMTVTLVKPDGLPDPFELYDKPLYFKINLMTNSGWQGVQTGVFIIKEVQLTDVGISIVAYDNMVKFDKPFVPKDIGIDGNTFAHSIMMDGSDTVYTLIEAVCEECGVELGMTESEMKELPNTTGSFGLWIFHNLFTINAKTYRELIAQIAEFTGSFATINNQGLLVFRTFKQDVDDNIGEFHRYHGSKFYGYHTVFSGIAFDRDDGSVIYPEGTDNGVVYALDRGNSFFDMAASSNFNDKLQWIKDAIKNIYDGSLAYVNHVPFDVTVPLTSAFELGDIVRFYGGRIEGLSQSGLYGRISRITISYPYGTNIQGVGENPMLAHPPSREELMLQKYSVYEPMINRYFSEHVQVVRESDFDPTATYDENTIIAVVEDY